MEGFLHPALLAAFAFTGANITDLFVLVLFFSKEKYKTKDIVIGQYLGVGGLIAVCLAVALLGGTLIPPAWAKLLGAIPVYVGIKNLFASLQNRREEEKSPPKWFNGHILEVASVAFADCSDNLAIFIPLLIKNNSEEKAVTVVTFLVLIAVSCYGAYLLTHHKRFGKAVRTYGSFLAPFVLIGLGGAILLS